MKNTIKNMIRADLYRINFCKGIYIAFTLMLLLLAISLYLVAPGTLGLENTATTDSTLSDLSPEEYYSLSFHELRQLRLNAENYALDRDIMASNINLYYVFIFLAAIVITCELSSGSFKTTLTFSVSRGTYFLAKCITVSVLCLGFHLLNTLIAYFGTLLFNKESLSAGFLEIAAAALLQIPAVIALSMVLSGLAFLLKKTWLYCVVTVPLVFVFQLLLGILVPMLRVHTSVFNYEYQLMFANLAHNPSVSYLLGSYAVCVLTIAIFGWLGYRSFRKLEAVK